MRKKKIEIREIKCLRRHLEKAYNKPKWTQKARWLGHISQMSEQIIVKMVLDGEGGKRRRHPKKKMVTRGQTGYRRDGNNRFEKIIKGPE